MTALPHASITSTVLLVALTLAACVTSEHGGGTPVEGALVSGRVTEGGGLRVRAYGLDADGMLVSASDTATTTADGRYVLRVTLPASATGLVVHVENGLERSVWLGRAAIDADLRSDAPIVLCPIDAASTYAARVAIAIETTDAQSTLAASASSLFLSPAASARIALADASVADGATAIADARETFTRALVRASSGAGSLPLALGHVAAAEARLAAGLDAATTALEADEAYAHYLDAVLVGLESAGFTSRDVALASLAASSSLEAHLGHGVGESGAALHVATAFAVTSAIDLGLAGAIDSTILRVESERLRADVLSAARDEDDHGAAALAWARYEEAIDAEIRTNAGLDRAAVASLGAEIGQATQALASAWAGPELSPSERVEAVLAFDEAVSSDAHLAMLEREGLMSSRAHAVLDALADVGASGVAR